MGTLFVVATPIGNLEDITLRALRTLKESDLILAEDTRQTKKILERYKIDKPILSYHQHSTDNERLKILGYLLRGKNLCLVSDSGTPGISDPGNELIDYLLEREKNLNIVPIPGPSALTCAISICGFRTNKFIFLGFFPKKRRKKTLELLSGLKYTFCFFESGRRILKVLEKMEERLGERRVVVGRELTKKFESIYRGKISEVRKMLMKEKKIKGELVVVVEGKG